MVTTLSKNQVREIIEKEITSGLKAIAYITKENTLVEVYGGISMNVIDRIEKKGLKLRHIDATTLISKYGKEFQGLKLVFESIGVE